MTKKGNIPVFDWKQFERLEVLISKYERIDKFVSNSEMAFSIDPDILFAILDEKSEIWKEIASFRFKFEKEPKQMM